MTPMEAAGRSFATVALAFALMTLVAAWGCEMIVGKDMPAFACDPGPDTCPQNQVCDGTTHQCVAFCDLAGCKDGLRCDSTTHLCVAADASTGDSDHTTTNDSDAATHDESSLPEAGDSDLGPCNGFGCRCSGDSDCGSGVCGDLTTVTSDIYNVAGGHSFCTKPCCTSLDCDPNTVCFATAVGGNYCVDPSWIGRGTALGSAKAGISCSGSSTCRSGLCVNGSCADTCCSTGESSSECGGSTVCQFSDFPGNGFDTHYAANCATVSGNGSSGSPCSGAGDCRSNLCWPGGGLGYCHDACRTENDCPSGQTCVPFVDASGDVEATCWPSVGNSSEGQTCQQDSDCLSDLCIGSACTASCFADGDCVSSVLPRCRPTPGMVQGGGSYFVLLCDK